MLAHVLEPRHALGPRRLVFITGYLGKQIEEWVESEYEVESVFVEQPVRRGKPTPSSGRVMQPTRMR